jgi:hypothetical protein
MVELALEKRMRQLIDTSMDGCIIELKTDFENCPEEA